MKPIFLFVRMFFQLLLLRSSHGMNEFHSTSEVRFLSLDEWLAEFRLYEEIKGLAFFQRFKKTKAFQTWKRVVKRQKFANASSVLLESSCILGNEDPKMRDAFLQVSNYSYFMRSF